MRENTKGGKSVINCSPLHELYKCLCSKWSGCITNVESNRMLVIFLPRGVFNIQAYLSTPLMSCGLVPLEELKHWTRLNLAPAQKESLLSIEPNPVARLWRRAGESEGGQEGLIQALKTMHRIWSGDIGGDGQQGQIHGLSRSRAANLKLLQHKMS